MYDHEPDQRAPLSAEERDRLERFRQKILARPQITSVLETAPANDGIDRKRLEAFRTRLFAKPYIAAVLTPDDSVGGFENSSEYMEFDKGIEDNIEQGVIGVREKDEFRAVAAANQWLDRRKNGWPHKQCIFEYIKKVYDPWLGKGMVQADLFAVDSAAYRALHKRLNTDPMPSWLPLPKLADAHLAAATDPKDRKWILAKRASTKRYKERLRQRQEAAGPEFSV
jgi:hypothetical protein